MMTWSNGISRPHPPSPSASACPSRGSRVCNISALTPLDNSSVSFSPSLGAPPVTLPLTPLPRRTPPVVCTQQSALQRHTFHGTISPRAAVLAVVVLDVRGEDWSNPMPQKQYLTHVSSNLRNHRRSLLSVMRSAYTLVFS